MHGINGVYKWIKHPGEDRGRETGVSGQPLKPNA